jgi:hypothetical protein
MLCATGNHRSSAQLVPRRYAAQAANRSDAKMEENDPRWLLTTADMRIFRYIGTRCDLATSLRS